MSQRCYSPSCNHAPATMMLDTGNRWPDGRVRWVFVCDNDVQKVIDAQRARGRTVSPEPISTEPAATCVACWRSHGCSLPDDHLDEHVCDPDDCGDRPRPGDRIFHYRTDAEVARLGGVPEGD